MRREPTRILLVEDNPADARYVQELLAETAQPEFALLHARWLSTGLDCLAEGGFDLALLDLALPDVEGISTIERVRAQAPAVPIIVVSGRGEEEVKSAALQAGAQEYLVKGQFDAVALHQAIRAAIGGKDRGA